MRKKVEKNTAAKRAVEKKAVSAVKPAETEVKAEAAPEAVAAETVSAVKAEEKPEVKAAEAEVQAEAKPAPKAAAKKTTKAAASQKIVLQLGGKGDLSMEDTINRVKDAYAAEGHSAASVKNIEVYIKPEENMAYYVIDGYASGISLY